MPKARPHRILLPDSLEKHFFRKALDQKQVLALRKLCESYQQNSQSHWKPSVIAPYSSYFGFLTALKFYRAMEELDSFGYLKAFQGRDLELVDIGAGTLGASLGASSYLTSKGLQISQISVLERKLEPVHWAHAEFSGFLPPRVRAIRRLPSRWPARPQIVLMGNVWAELWNSRSSRVQDEFLTSLKKATQHQLFVIVEPADKATNQKLLEFRNEIRHETRVLLPCTHQRPCPALTQNEWCHEEYDYRAPARFWELVRGLGFQKSRLTFSYLCFGKQKPAFTASDARVVSQDIGGKGKCQKWLCAEGKRWKASVLEKHRNLQNESFLDAARGAVVDCGSTPEIKPD